MEHKYTSLELSKKLKKAGCKIKSKYLWDIEESRFYTPADQELFEEMHCLYIEDVAKCCPAYDLLWDICIKHPKEFFKFIDILEHTSEILTFLQDGRKREAEQYFWENCLFNKEK